MNKSKPNGYVLYEGPSEINGEEIICILTGITKPSHNPKTSVMIQTWILPKSIHPMEAIKTNQDQSVCGNCPLKGDGGKNRACYVNKMTLGQIYKAYLNGNYPPIENLNFLRNRGLRLGSFGEPTAVPIEVWKPLLKKCQMHTGYTHRWKTCDPEWKNYLQASVESEAGKQEANKLGWHTFRVKLPNTPKLPHEVVCPASEEAGFATQCINCGLCNGQSTDVVINIHGIGAKYFAA